MTRNELLEKVFAKRTIPFFGTLDNDLYVAVRNAILAMDAETMAPIAMVFDSTGGGAFLSLQLGDILRMTKSEVVGIALQANSAALTVLQYCDQRILVSSGSVLIHSAQARTEDLAGWKHDEYWRSRMELVDATLTHYNSKLQKLFSERTGASQERILELMKRGDNLSWPIFAEEALELKLVDSILPTDYNLFMPTAFPKLETPTEEKKEP